MEYKKKNWNNILNNFIASTALVLVSLLIGLFFIPVLRVGAQTEPTPVSKESLVANNINFNFAKTKARSASGLQKQQLTAYNGANSSKSIYKYAYTYNYFGDTKLYDSFAEDKNNDSTYLSYDSNSKGNNFSPLGFSSVDRNNIHYNYIPSNADYFDNTHGQKEVLFSDIIENDDYVLLNNFNSHHDHSLDKNFNVENLYLSFGAPFDGDDDDLNDLLYLQVKATLATTRINANGIEEPMFYDNLVLDDPTPYSYGDGENKKTGFYWSQFFDLYNLTAKIQDKYYDVENLQGKYTFTFIFSNTSSDPNNPGDQQSYTISFYLLDSAEYSEYPEFVNGEILENLSDNKTTTYYYNFTEENPSIIYDPTRFNLSYNRVNSKNLTYVNDNITSEYLSSTYKIIHGETEQKTMPRGVINYYKNDKLLKQVYILTNYNTEKTIIEYLYLSKTNFSSNTSIPESYTAFANEIENGSMIFEYKITTILDKSVANKYTISSYKTEEYSERGLSNFSTAPIDLDSDNKYTCLNKYTYTVDSNTISKSDKDLITFGNNVSSGELIPTSSDVSIPNIGSDYGVLINTTPGTNYLKASNVADSAVNPTQNQNIYKLEYENNVYALEKIVLNTQTGEPNSTTTTLSTAQLGLNELTDGNITIQYYVNETPQGDPATTTRTINSVVFVDKTYTNVDSYNFGLNQKTLNEIIDIDTMSLKFDYQYEYKISDLGEYNFTYKYVLPIAKFENTSYKTSYEVDSNDTLIPVDFAVEEAWLAPNNTNSTNDNTTPLYAVSSAILNGSDNTTSYYYAVINGTTYYYDRQNNIIKIKDDSENKEYPTNGSAGPISQLGAQNAAQGVQVNFLVELNSRGKYVLNVRYKIGTVETTTSTTKYTTKLNDKDNYRNLTKTVTTYTYTLDFSSDDINDKYENIRNVILSIEDNNSISILTTEKEEVTQGKDTLHIFGTIAHFNKTDASTDKGLAKLEQHDKKEGLEFVSDVTSLLYQSPYVINSEVMVSLYKGNNTESEVLATHGQNTIDGYVETNKIYKFGPYYKFGDNNKSKILDASVFKGNIATLLKKDQFIRTDMVPVQWTDLATLSYTNKNISNSYIYRYTNYKFNEDGSINLSNATCQTSTFNKGVYCQFDGLYEVVVFYTYNDLPDECKDRIYYQVFTFIIDNSAPSLDIQVNDIDENNGNEKLDDNNNIIYSSLGINKYTNRNVRLVWEANTYFKNEIFIKVVRNNYNNENISNTIYKYNSADETVKYFIVPEENNKKYYYIDIIGNADETNGNYLVTICYNFDGKSSFSNNFVIDKTPIDGFEISAITKGDDGTYSIDQNTKISSQITNKNFTFRYDAKDSNAEIYTYYDKIPLASYENKDQIIHLLDKESNIIDDKFGITTNYYLDIDNMTENTKYDYNYDKDESVDTKNVIISNTSCIYLFRLVDAAGNQARFVVFYDETTPRFITSPTPDPITRISNTTTRTIWGDYKAIKIGPDDSNESYNNLDKSVSNTGYMNLSEKSSKLQAILQYLNKENQTGVSSKDKVIFDGLKVENTNTGYYLMIPNNNVDIQDQAFNRDVEESLKVDLATDYDDFYFFPKNPIVKYDENDNKLEDGSQYTGTITNKITLPEYDANNGRVINNKEKTYIVKNSTPIHTTNLQGTIEIRYIFIEYYVDEQKTTTETIIGSIGNGQFLYSVNDKVGNIASSLVWINTDLTQTTAFGIYNYSSELKYNTSSSYEKSGLLSLSNPNSGALHSASSIYISSIVDEDSIPSYTISYEFYPYDAASYSKLTDDNITSIRVEEQEDNSKYLIIKLKTNEEIKVKLSDEDGNEYPIHSYPYSLTYASQEDNVYEEFGSEFLMFDNVNSNRIVTKKGINTFEKNLTTNNTTQTYTEEGLYIFKREYDKTEFENSQNEKLEDDSRIIYLVYYIDRSGIINNLTPSDISFTLASDSTDNNIRYKVDSNEIINSASNDSTSSNSSHKKESLFNTNKTLVQFTKALDKHNFDKFLSGVSSDTTGTLLSKKIQVDESLDSDKKDAAKNNISSYLNNYLFNKSYYRDYLYSIDMKLEINNSETINEKRNYYSSSGISAYLKGATKDSVVSIVDKETDYYFYYDTDDTAYKITLSDNAGYIKYDSDGTLIEDDNYLANSLFMTFKISHKAPEGSFYGKYYGTQNYDRNAPIIDPVTGAETKPSNSSIPLDNGKYALLSTYLEGNLDPLSSSSSGIVTETYEDGQLVTLQSTNNETLIFVFSITNDNYKAKIDPNNITITKDGVTIYRKYTEEGSNIPKYDEHLTISQQRQMNATVHETINGIEYYGIIIFDNNLDDILDDSEKETCDFRLLNAAQNSDRSNYTITLKYTGDKDNYVGQDGSGKKRYHQTTYYITVDRIKPTYNLTQLMALDKYTYHNITTTLTEENYEELFEKYSASNIYNFHEEDIEGTNKTFTRSNIENYFFALDCREDSSFVFKSVNDQDNNGAIYIRNINKDNYKFTLTPDDYTAYYTSEYFPGHPQFSASNISVIPEETTESPIKNQTTYYKLLFDDDGKISARELYNRNIIKENQYYEIIEEDEAGNYRVYAVYIPQQQSNLITYNYQKDSNLSSIQTGVTLDPINLPYRTSSGMKLEFTSIRTKDNFLRADINFDIKTKNNGNLKDFLTVMLDPNTLTVKVIGRNTNIDFTFNCSGKDIGTDDKYTNTEAFIEALNYTLNYYYDKVNNESNYYYSEYGYTVKIDIIDRIGVKYANQSKSFDYELTYVVAGSLIKPDFLPPEEDTSSDKKSTQFKMILPGQKGSTQIVSLIVYKFNSEWTTINVDNTELPEPQLFNKTLDEFKEEIVYRFNKGIYRFVIKDNFERVTEHYYEFGISTSQTGGQLSFSDSNTTLSDGYTYTGKTAEYKFDNNVYNVLIKYTGKFPNPVLENSYDNIDEIIFNSSVKYTEEYLNSYGLSVLVSGTTTTIKFTGVKNIDLSKYHIKTILAQTSTNYDWGDENLPDSKIIVYNKKIAIYSAVQNVNIKNLSGTPLLNTSGTDTEHLNLTEDFEIVTMWSDDVDQSDRLSFNSRIILTRNYNENGFVKTSTSTVSSGQIITLPGTYTAYVINDLGLKSKVITFTRGEGQISMYAVYAVDKGNSIEKSLSPSSQVDATDDGKVLFTYFITSDYFAYKDTRDNAKITIENISSYENDENISTNIAINTASKKYLDVRVNSNLKIKTDIIQIGQLANYGYPFVQYQIYSKTKTDEIYTYRYIKIVFVDETASTQLANINISNTGESETNILGSSSIVTSTAKSININLNFITNDTSLPFVPTGDTLFLDRYYNGTFIETITISSDTLHLKIEKVGLHEFKLHDLAGRTHKFEDSSDILKIYLINQILFTVNGNSPINNQIFNDSVNIEIIYDLPGMSNLYEKRTTKIELIKDGDEVDANDSNGKFKVSALGYSFYTVKLKANTSLPGTSTIQITTVYNFVTIDNEIATRVFSVSKNSGLSLEKLIKNVNGEKTDITSEYPKMLQENAVKNNYNASEYLLYLNYKEQGNSKFEVTLKYYDGTEDTYKTYSFEVWINNETPEIISSIPHGNSTKETISISYNPGLIYQQIGKGYIKLNDKLITEIDENSRQTVETITISEKGVYWLKIYTEDGDSVGTYKFTKTNPINNVAKIIIICVAIGIVVVVGLFFFLRRKGKYR